MVAAAGEPLNCQRANPEVTVKLPSADVVPRLRGRQRVVVHVDSRTARCVGALALVCAACWLIALLAGDYRHAQWAVAGRLGWSLTVLAAVAFIARGIFLGRPVTAMHATAAGLFLLAGLAAHVLVADLLGEILIAGSGWALMWPTSAHPRPEDLPRVWALINATRADSLAPFAMQAGKSHHFSAAGTAALAYRTRIGYAVVSGDPIGDEAQFPQLVADFAAMCHMHGGESWSWAAANDGSACGATPWWSDNRCGPYRLAGMSSSTCLTLR